MTDREQQTYRRVRVGRTPSRKDSQYTDDERARFAALLADAGVEREARIEAHTRRVQAELARLAAKGVGR